MDISIIFSLGKDLTFERLSVKDSDAKIREGTKYLQLFQSLDFFSELYMKKR